jgi:hypothetical protein
MLNKHSMINIFHVLVVFPLICYLYYIGINKKLSGTVCNTLILVSVIGTIYHLYLSKDRGGVYKAWVNLIHILIVFPLLFIIGYKCEEVKRGFLEMLLLVGFAAVGYHSFNFVKYYE